MEHQPLVNKRRKLNGNPRRKSSSPDDPDETRLHSLQPAAMRAMTMWKIFLVAATLSLFDCTAKKSPAAPPARRPQINSNKATAGKRPRVAAADARKR